MRCIKKQNQILKQDIACKLFTFETHPQQQEYLRMLKNAQSYDNIPTLITIVSHEDDKESGGSRNGRVFGGCMNTYKVKLYFQYHNHTLEAILHKRRSEIADHKQKMRQKNKSEEILPQGLKLCDYETIDQMSHSDRKLVNLFYQEV